MRILACVDFTRIAGEVVSAAGDLAGSDGGQVTVLHAAAPEPDFVGYDAEILTSEARDEELAREREQLQAHVARLQERDVAAESVLRVGPTTATVLAIADEIDADVIVVGRHRHGRLHDVVLGSIARDLARKSTRPLLLVPPPIDR